MRKVFQFVLLLSCVTLAGCSGTSQASIESQFKTVFKAKSVKITESLGDGKYKGTGVDSQGRTFEFTLTYKEEGKSKNFTWESKASDGEVGSGNSSFSGNN